MAGGDKESLACLSDNVFHAWNMPPDITFECNFNLEQRYVKPCKEDTWKRVLKIGGKSSLTVSDCYYQNTVQNWHNFSFVFWSQMILQQDQNWKMTTDIVMNFKRNVSRSFNTMLMSSKNAYLYWKYFIEEDGLLRFAFILLFSYFWWLISWIPLGILELFPSLVASAF